MVIIGTTLLIKMSNIGMMVKLEEIQMINFLSSWVKNLCLALIVVSILEMLLPNNKTKQYVKMVFGLYILFSIIAPFIKNKNELQIDVEDLYNKYSIQASTMTEKVDQTSMDNRLDQLYVEKLENDIIQKVIEEGYEVEECNVKAHISNEDTGIELITLKLKEKIQTDENVEDSNLTNSTKNADTNYSRDSIENKLVKEIQKIQEIQIRTSKNEVQEQKKYNETTEKITRSDINKIKKLLTKEYGVSEKCLRIS